MLCHTNSPTGWPSTPFPGIPSLLRGGCLGYIPVPCFPMTCRPEIWSVGSSLVVCISHTEQHHAYKCADLHVLVWGKGDFQDYILHLEPLRILHQYSTSPPLCYRFVRLRDTRARCWRIIAHLRVMIVQMAITQFGVFHETMFARLRRYI